MTIVDSGYPEDRALVDAAVDRVGRSLGDVEAMVLTHGRVDHKGSAERLRTDHGITVHCHDREAPIARGELTQQISTWELRRAWRPGVFRFAVHAIAGGGLRPAHVSEVVTFADGESIDVPGAPIAVFTPGRTQGQCRFHLPDRGVIITEDALITVDLWDPGSRGPIRRPFNHDREKALRSLNRFEELDAEVIVPGHGEPWHGSPSRAVELVRAGT